MTTKRFLDNPIDVFVLILRSRTVPSERAALRSSPAIAEAVAEGSSRLSIGVTAL